MFEVFTHGFTFLNLLSIIAFITTVGLFFCGIPICRQIWKRGDTKEISGAPFLMGILGGNCWLVYGYLKGDHTVMWVTGVQVLLYSTYSIFYWFMTKAKLGITLRIAGIVSLCILLWALVLLFGHKVFHPLGFICMTLNAADFAAPLAGLKVVIRRGATSTLPLPLCIANFMVSSEWFLYGLLVWDFYLITPNGIGSLLAAGQLVLFIVLPRKPGQKAPIRRLTNWICGPCCGPSENDKMAVVETGTTEKDGKDTANAGAGEGTLCRSQRWSKRLMQNVTAPLDAISTKVAIHEQFSYSNKLNKSESVDSDDASSDNNKTVTESPVASLDVEALASSVIEQTAERKGVANRLRERQLHLAALVRLARTNSCPELSD